MSEPAPCVYIATCGASGKSYVGKSRHHEARWRQHVVDANSGKGHAFHNAIRKHGADAFSFSVIEWCDSDEDALAAEKFWIEWYQTLSPLGYNLTKGGDAGLEFSEETRRKMSEAQSRRAPPTPETRAKMSAAGRGRKLSPEHIEKCASARRGRRMSEEQKEKLRQANLGKTASEETRAKMSEAHKGRVRSKEANAKCREKRLGMKFGEDFREKIRQSWVLRKARAAAEKAQVGLWSE